LIDRQTSTSKPDKESRMMDKQILWKVPAGMILTAFLAYMGFGWIQTRDPLSLLFFLGVGFIVLACFAWIVGLTLLIGEILSAVNDFRWSA
jgi:hypothetical protein